MELANENIPQIEIVETTQFACKPAHIALLIEKYHFRKYCQTLRH